MNGKPICLLHRTWLVPGGRWEGTCYTVWHPWPHGFTQGWLHVSVEEGGEDDRILLEPQVTADRALIAALEPVRSAPESVTVALVRNIRGSSLRARVAFALRRRARVSAEITPVSQ